MRTDIDMCVEVVGLVGTSKFTVTSSIMAGIPRNTFTLYQNKIIETLDVQFNL